MPLPPSALDFASSAQFWDLFSDLCNQLVRSRGQDKSFEFIDVLLSRVEATDAASSVVRQWVIEGYGEKVLPIEIPKTSVTATASAEFGTVYDLPRGAMNAKTFSRARDAYDRIVNSWSSKSRRFGHRNWRRWGCEMSFRIKASKIDFATLPGSTQPPNSATGSGTALGEGAELKRPKTAPGAMMAFAGDQRSELLQEQEAIKVSWARRSMN